MPWRKSFNSNEEYNEWYRIYRADNYEKIKEYRRAYIKEYRRKNGTVKDGARDKLNRAIKSGEVKRQPCVICGNKKSHGHHEDYSKPLSVVWLCIYHHNLLHREKKKISTVA